MATGMALIQVLPVTAAAMLISPVASLGFGVASALITGGIYAAHQSGLIPITTPQAWATAEPQHHVITITVLVILGALSWLVGQTMHSATRQTYATTKELQRYKDGLEQVVAERTRELTETRTRPYPTCHLYANRRRSRASHRVILEMEPLLNQTARLICEPF